MRQLSQSAFCVLLLTVLACVAAQSEELQWIKWDESGGGNGHEYAVLTAPASWTSQKALAEAEGGYLATVLSAEEQAFVMSVIGAAEASERATSDYYWFGLFQDSAAAEPDEGWQWVTGEALADTFCNWALIEPNNQGEEDVGAISRRDGKWIDGRAYVANRAVIERAPQDDPPPPPPVPRSIDETAPVLVLNSPEPPVLPWRRPFQRKRVEISGQVTDDDSGVASATITVTDEYRRRPKVYDITDRLDEDGCFTLVLWLSSWVRARDRDGRVYEIALTAADAAGNEAGPESVFVLAKRPGRGHHRGHR